MNKKLSNKFRSRLGFMGRDGVFTLLLSNTVILLSVGISLWWQLWSVIKLANDTPTKISDGSTILVLGMRLDKGNREPSSDFKSRLERAYQCWRKDPGSRVLVLGGATSDASISEAACGREYLMARGIPRDRVFVEEKSQHTLENLRNARLFLERFSSQRFAIVTSRYHLSRSEIIAKGLGMKPELCAAEDKLDLSASRLPRLLLEAYYIHWYKVGSVWSKLTGNRRSLARIS